MNKKIMITIIVLLTLVITFVLINKMFELPGIDKKLGCDIYISGDPALHFYPMDESNSDYTNYKTACESRATCEWKSPDNIKFTCVDKS